MQRIGITGVSSTGKSTLASLISNEINLSLISDVEVHERSWNKLTEWGKHPDTRYFPHLTPEEHINFERAVGLSFLELVEEKGDFVSDESPLDFLNYFYLICSKHSDDLIPSDELHLMIDAMWKCLQTYDIIFYLPFGKIEVVDDKRRFTNKHLLQSWEYSLQGLLLDAINRGVKIHPLHADTPETRLEDIREYIGSTNIS
jgi:hypothetical protein